MPHSQQAFSAPSSPMLASNPKGDRNSIASTSVSSTISIHSCEPSASKPRDKNPRYRHDNGLRLACRGNAAAGFLKRFSPVRFAIHSAGPSAADGGNITVNPHSGDWVAPGNGLDMHLGRTDRQRWRERCNFNRTHRADQN